MISAGTNIISNADSLQKVTIRHLFDSLRNPHPEVLAKIRQLRIVRELDSKQYNVLKRQLPYFVCGIFNPNFRKTENFAYTEYFIIDIDHITEKGFSVEDLRNKLEQDSRIVLSFLSPGENGLKLLFNLKERCYDSGVYNTFYKIFLKEFSNQYNLQQVADTRTSDVTRACFVSVDTNVYYIPNADKIDLSAYINLDDLSSLYEQTHKKKKQIAPTTTINENKSCNDPDIETMKRIRSLLNPKKEREKPDVFVPQVLNDIMDDLTAYISETGIIVKEIINIQYGKKLRFTMGTKQAEVNLFYGKKGFSVVKSPRTGTNKELNDLMAELVSTFVLSL